ncbi:unnamed protein product [Cochlearia groenlandica]
MGRCGRSNDGGVRPYVRSPIPRLRWTPDLQMYRGSKPTLLGRLSNKFCSFVIIIILSSFTLGGLEALEVGFYEKTCIGAESTIRHVVEQQVAIEPRRAPQLLRLQFHDCFVEGCDASILLTTGDQSEMLAAGNAGVTGLGIIQLAKDAVESLCPGVVSCADIIALAARDVVVLTNGPTYMVPTGRKDGRISNAEHAVNLPDPQDSIEVLKLKFRQQGLSDKDLVLLSAGAHTIGLTACFFVTPRLEARDPTIISPEFFKILRSKCPKGGDVGFKIPLDWDGEFVFDDHILRNIQKGRSVIASDSVLYRDKITKGIIDSYLVNGSSKADFSADFTKAMVKLGSIKVKTGMEGEIRRICNATN